MISPISARPRPTRAAYSVASPVPPPWDCISIGPPFPRSVSHTLADREPPATARETLPEAIADGELRHVAADGARRADAQRHAEVPSQPRRLVHVPGTTVVERSEERRVGKECRSRRSKEDSKKKESKEKDRGSVADGSRCTRCN